MKNFLAPVLFLLRLCTCDTDINNKFDSLKSIDIPSYFEDALLLPNQFTPKAPKIYSPAIIPYNTFIATLEEVTQLNTNLNPNGWFNGIFPEIYYPDDQTNESYEVGAYIQKKIIPMGSKIICIGDLHGNIHGLIAIIEKLKQDRYLDKQLKLIKPNTYIIFLGDMVDYGVYGSDTLFTALQLRLRNPQNVFICRGNHEQVKSFSKDFSNEVRERYPFLDDQAFENFTFTMAKLCSVLPCALFLGIKDKPKAGFALCCHGGIEEGAQNQIQALLKSTCEFIPLDYDSCFESCMCGFNWNDISGKETLLYEERWPRWQHMQRSCAYMATMKHCQVNTLIEIRHFFDDLNIRILLRGHQDLCNPFKVSIPGIHLPIYPFFNTTSGYVKEFYSSTDYQTIPWEKVEFLRPDALYNQGFLIKDFIKTLQAPACVLTFSNAGVCKGLEDNGCGIITIGQSWEESLVRVIILPAH